jgi:hypothetical protein
MRTSSSPFDDMEKALDLALLYEEAHGNRQIRDYCAQMVTRFKWILWSEKSSHFCACTLRCCLNTNLIARSLWNAA